MRGYKGMTKDMTCRGFKFEVGKSYHADGEIQLCKNGFHFCENLNDVFKFYEPRNGNRFFEVRSINTTISDLNGVKSVARDIEIIRELSDREVYRAFYGNGNGYGDGDGNGDGNGDGDGNGYGYGDGDGDGYGNGYGYGYGYGYGDGDGDGNGDGNGDGDGNGYGNGDGYGDGNGDGYGDGNIQRVLIFK